VILGAYLVSAPVNSGIVQDPSGAAIAKAEVTVTNVDTGNVRTEPNLTAFSVERHRATELEVVQPIRDLREGLHEVLQANS